MKRCRHKKCREVSGAICNGSQGRRFVVRVQQAPRYRWVIIGKPTTSYRVALRRMADAMVGHLWRRGSVWLLADYYDPVRIAFLEAE